MGCQLGHHVAVPSIFPCKQWELWWWRMVGRTGSSLSSYLNVVQVQAPTSICSVALGKPFPFSGLQLHSRESARAELGNC